MKDSMIGARLEQYEITGHLGQGGMGEVYRAVDSRLGRSVAIKLLPEMFARDAERSARLEREARVLASLNHPGIAAIYDIEQASGRSFIVMEFVPGETLAEIVKRGPMSIPGAIGIALQICEALEVAHERGITHRDLKPANVKVTPEGKVKILDFGLAKPAAGVDAPNPALSNSPTLSVAATQAGVILGTAAYMSPEQAKGRSVDRRTDIFAFGCVLFEMLTGRPMFDGEDVQDILGSVLKTEPDWTRLPAPTPPAIRKLLQRCVAKDVKQRLQAIGEARIVLEQPASAENEQPVAVPPRRVWQGIAIQTVFAAIAASAVWFFKPVPGPPLLTLEIAAPEGNPFAAEEPGFVLSPDGRRAVYMARNRQGQFDLRIRTLDSGATTSLSGTEGASRPFWSPDSRWIGFFAAGKLQKIAADGGRPQVICDAIESFGTWNRDGVIVFADARTLLKVSSSGGTPTAFLPLDESRHETAQTVPSFLPDDKHLLYDSRASGAERGIVWASLDGKERRFLIQNRSSPATYAINPGGGPGWMIYNSGGRLLAQLLDPVKGEIRSEPILIADNVQVGPTWSTSENGMISFPHAPDIQRQLTWIRRDGTRLGVAGDRGNIGQQFSISPDQKAIAFARRDAASIDIWLLDGTGGIARRLTFETGANPVWTPDGAHVVYASQRQKVRYLIDAAVAGGEAILKKFDDTDNRSPTAITRDGRWVSYAEGGGGDGRLRFISRPEGTVVPFAEPRASGVISPDGKWVAYTTTGASPLFVQSSPKELSGIANGLKFQISTTASRAPEWRADGKEIFYISAEGMMMSVPIESGEGALRPGTPKALFDVGDIAGYAVTDDGQRFLLPSTAAGTLDTPITIVQNWQLLLRK